MSRIIAFIAALLVLGTLSSQKALAYEAPANSRAAVRDVDFANATPLDEAYRQEFRKCDNNNTFHGDALTGWRKCSGDKNNVEALLKFADGAIFFEAKMSLDIDGSWKACNSPGLADLCPTWYTWPGMTGRSSYINSDTIPFVVIPIAGPDRWKTEFRDKTGIRRGDFAMVVYDGHVVPAIVGDGGPYNKLGEGSNALFKAVGKDRCRRTNADGHCTKYLEASIESKVLYFVFPGTASRDITPANAIEMMKTVANRRFEALKRH